MRKEKKKKKGEELCDLLKTLMPCIKIFQIYCLHFVHIQRSIKMNLHGEDVGKVINNYEKIIVNEELIFEQLLRLLLIT